MQDPVFPGPAVTDDGDSLWKHVEIVRYADLAQREFARFTEWFYDRSFVPVVTADDPWVTLDPRVIRVERAKLVTLNRPVVVCATARLDEYMPSIDAYDNNWSSDWESITGTPKIALTDQEQGKLRLVPIPVDADTLQLTAVRFPLRELKDYTFGMEVTDPEHQDALLDYMRYRGYTKQDADAFDEDAAAAALTAFRGKAQVIKRRIALQRHPVGAIAYGGY